MPEAYPTAYQGVAARGPQLPAPATPAYEQRLASATNNVLGDDGGNGNTYTATQRALFPWYSHLFLGRGKPATHVVALGTLTDAQIEHSLPPVLQRLRARIAQAVAP